MKVMIISPLAFAYTQASRYVGIERLCWEFANQLAALKHSVAVVAPIGAEMPEGVELIAPVGPNFDTMLEVRAYQYYHHRIRLFDVIHDFSHLHLVARYNANMPTLNIFWHAPQLAQYPKAPYNIVALSNWAAYEFQKYYNQKAIYQQSIAINSHEYTVGTTRGDRLLTIGRMSQEKGNLEAAQFCKEHKLALDIVGGRGAEKTATDKLTAYESQIMKLCDGEQIKFLGEVDESTKIGLMRTCRALIYITNHPEVTSHKTMEAQLCGAPALVPAIGAMNEVIIDGMTGYCCETYEDYLNATSRVSKIDPQDCGKWALQYDAAMVVRGYLPLYEKVANGLRWK